MPPAGFEPTIPASERLQTDALHWDRLHETHSNFNSVPPIARTHALTRTVKYYTAPIRISKVSFSK